MKLFYLVKKSFKSKYRNEYVPIQFQVLCQEFHCFDTQFNFFIGIIEKEIKKNNLANIFVLDLNNKDEKDGKGENNVESSKPKLATKQYLGIKPLQLLTEPKVNKKVMT